MTYLVKKFLDLNVVAEIAVFEPVDKVHEFQVMVHVDAAMMTFQEQLDALQVSLHSLLADDVLRDAVPVFAHCFMSDVANQQEEVSLILSEQLNCTVSCVKQPPLDGSKLALWLQLQTGV